MLSNNICEECKDFELKMEKKLDYPERENTWFPRYS
jgi:hypothetical protein